MVLKKTWPVNGIFGDDLGPLRTGPPIVFPDITIKGTVTGRMTSPKIPHPHKKKKPPLSGTRARTIIHDGVSETYIEKKVNNMQTLTPSEIKEFIINCMQCGEIPYVAGEPAIGKSDIFFEVARDANLKMLDIRLSQKMSEDLTGLPSLDEKRGKALYNPFDTFPMEDDPLPLDDDGNVMQGWMIFLDELSSASDEIWAAIYSLLLGHMLGERKLHPQALICAAGNLSTNSAIARPLPDTLITRMLCREMRVNPKDWIKWAENPENGKVQLASSEILIEYIKKNPDMLHIPPGNDNVPGAMKTTKKELEPYPQPRGWGKIFGFLSHHEKKGKPQKVLTDSAGIPITAAIDETNTMHELTQPIMNMIEAAVGFMAGHAFAEHYNEILVIPQPWDVAQSPTSTKIPGTVGGKTKMVTSLSSYFLTAKEQSRDSILQFMNRMSNEYGKLFAEQIKQQLGTTPTDLHMVEEVHKRLGVPLTAEENINTALGIATEGTASFSGAPITGTAGVAITP